MLERYPQFRQWECAIPVFNALYNAKDIQMLDDIYSKYYNTEHIPFAAQPTDSSDGDKRSLMWELHNYSVGIAVACIRFGSKFIRPGKWGLVSVGRGKHQRGKRDKSLKDELLKCPHLGKVQVKEDRNPGRLQIRLM